MGHMSVSTTIGIHVCMCLASCDSHALPRGFESKVDLPAPFRPTSTTRAPKGTLKPTPCSTSLSATLASRGQAACRSSGWRATDQACMTTDALEGAGEARLTEFELGDAKLSCGVKNALERR